MRSNTVDAYDEHLQSHLYKVEERHKENPDFNGEVREANLNRAANDYANGNPRIRSPFYT